MTWDELVEKVKNIVDISIKSDCIYYGALCFDKNGDVHSISSSGFTFVVGNRTPDQMYAIITAITETKE